MTLCGSSTLQDMNFLLDFAVKISPWKALPYPKWFWSFEGRHLPINDEQCSFQICNLSSNPKVLHLKEIGWRLSFFLQREYEYILPFTALFAKTLAIVGELPLMAQPSKGLIPSQSRALRASLVKSFLLSTYCNKTKVCPKVNDNTFRPSFDIFSNCNL